MGKTVVKIDDLLAKNSLDIILGDKTYTVNDFDLEGFLGIMDIADDTNPRAQNDALREQLAKAFNCEISEMKELGMRTLMMIVKTIRDWIIGESSDTVTEGDPSNP